MPSKKKPPTEEERFEEKFGEDALEELMEMMEDFPELEDYIDEDIFEMDDEDFYSGENK